VNIEMGTPEGRCMAASGLPRFCLVVTMISLLATSSWAGSLDSENNSENDEPLDSFPILNDAQSEALSQGRGVTQWLLQGTEGPNSNNGPGDYNGVWISDIVSTSNNAIIITGSYRGDVRFGPSTVPSVYNKPMAFIAQMDQWGSFSWFVHSNRPSDSTGGAHSEELSLSPAGVWICGWIYETITLGSHTLTTGGAYRDGFAALYNISTSTWDTAISFGGPNNDVANACQSTSDGGVYVGGAYSGTAYMGSNTHTSEGGYDMYLLMLDSNGAVVWTKSWGGEYNDNVTGIALDGAQNAYVVGYYRDNVLNWPNQILVQAGLPYAGFVTKVNPGGTFQWASEIIGGVSGDGVVAYAAAFGNGDLYVGGQFWGEAEFTEGGTKTYNLIANSSADNAWIASIDPTGSWNWVQRTGGESNSVQGITDISVGPNGDLAVTGSVSDWNDYWTNVSFGNIHLTRGPYEESFVAGINQYGTWVWADGMGSDSDDYGMGITWFGLGRVVAVGRYCVDQTSYCTGSFGPISTLTTGSYIEGASYIWSFKVDSDKDTIADLDDNCPNHSNVGQEDIDGDLLGDACDFDADGDGFDDYYDQCVGPEVNWNQSIWALDRDGDGCNDALEDDDDDGDGISDATDSCNSASNKHNWTSNGAEDYDTDGCHDGDEDDDDDSDGIVDSSDSCPRYPFNRSWTSSAATDYDSDGCNDHDDDLDDDSDGIVDASDNCPKGNTGWVSSVATDFDSDGCLDSGEDDDDDGDGVLDLLDDCQGLATNWTSVTGTDRDGDGCRDYDEDSDDDGDGLLDENDDCPVGQISWISNSETDYDGDGCQDGGEDIDDDNDSILNDFDWCVRGKVDWTSTALVDVDNDGCHDAEEDSDLDNDWIDDVNDNCPGTPFGLVVDATGCSDLQQDADGDGILNGDDICRDEPATSGYDTNFDGCTDDVDEDLVPDDIEPPQCLGTPAGEQVDSDGCGYVTQQDTDKDGVFDNIDACTDTSSESIRAEYPEFEFDSDFGCWTGNLDNDDDGYENWVDICPNSNSSETVFSGGCNFSQQDSDGDGVTNLIDGCPGTAEGAVIDLNGCSKQQSNLASEEGMSTGVLVAIIVASILVIIGGSFAAILILKQSKQSKKDKRRKSQRETDAMVSEKLDQSGGDGSSESTIDDYQSDPNYKVDEDGCEWWMDEDQKWWYRTPEMDDWAEHTD
jgi:hypothetical protein